MNETNQIKGNEDGTWRSRHRFRSNGSVPSGWNRINEPPSDSSLGPPNSDAEITIIGSQEHDATSFFWFTKLLQPVVKRWWRGKTKTQISFRLKSLVHKRPFCLAQSQFFIILKTESEEIEGNNHCFFKLKSLLLHLIHFSNWRKSRAIIEANNLPAIGSWKS